MCLAALALLAISYPAQLQATNYTDIDLLNFALNLEYLEAEFYSYAAYGYGLSAEDRGNGSASIGGQKANLTAFGQVIRNPFSTCLLVDLTKCLRKHVNLCHKIGS